VKAEQSEGNVLAVKTGKAGFNYLQAAGWMNSYGEC